MALTENLNYATKHTEVWAGKSNVADTYFQGALLNWNSSGYLKVAADASGEVFAGVCKKKVVVESGETKDIEFEVGIIRIPHSGAAQTDVGTLAYATADDTLASSATNVKAAGLIIGVETGYWWIDTRIRTLG